MKLFISYSSQNAKFVDKLDAELRKQGFTVLRDKHFMRGGRKFDKEIGQRIRDCDVLLFVASAEALQSQWVEAEIDFAFDLRKVIIPLRMDDAHELPWYLAHVHYHRMVTQSEQDLATARLIVELSEVASELEQHPDTPLIPPAPPQSASSALVSRLSTNEAVPSKIVLETPAFVVGSRVETELFVGREPLLADVQSWVYLPPKSRPQKGKT